VAISWTAETQPKKSHKEAFWGTKQPSGGHQKVLAYVPGRPANCEHTTGGGAEKKKEGKPRGGKKELVKRGGEVTKNIQLRFLAIVGGGREPRTTET